MAGLLGLAFGSFLNVCLSRWPTDESVVKPRSHCRSCGRTLAWWENVPLASWPALRGRCRTCGIGISWRYPLVESTGGGLWAILAWRFLELALDPYVRAISPFVHYNVYNEFGRVIELALFFWLLVALALLDAENLWLPDWLTFPGIALGVVSTVAYRVIEERSSEAPGEPAGSTLASSLGSSLVAILIAAGLVLLIRWVYWLMRRREGIGLGDAKLMAMLGAWLGVSGALLAFAIGVVLGAITALVVLAVPAARRGTETWAATKLPLGTFLCIGGIVTGLWGQQIIAAYLRWSGLA